MNKRTTRIIGFVLLVISGFLIAVAMKKAPHHFFTGALFFIAGLICRFWHGVD